ncbi:MAG: hypothetical protein V1659_01105 [Candidatus Woesearchaeota archaeon]
MIIKKEERRGAYFAAATLAALLAVLYGSRCNPEVKTESTPQSQTTEPPRPRRMINGRVDTGAAFFRPRQHVEIPETAKDVGYRTFGIMFSEPDYVRGYMFNRLLTGADLTALFPSAEGLDPNGNYTAFTVHSREDRTTGTIEEFMVFYSGNAMPYPGSGPLPLIPKGDLGTLGKPDTAWTTSRPIPKGHETEEDMHLRVGGLLRDNGWVDTEADAAR